MLQKNILTNACVLYRYSNSQVRSAFPSSTVQFPTIWSNPVPIHPPIIRSLLYAGITVLYFRNQNLLGSYWKNDKKNEGEEREVTEGGSINKEDGRVDSHNPCYGYKTVRTQVMKYATDFNLLSRQLLDLLRCKIS
jgi:hypothetical protein